MESDTLSVRGMLIIPTTTNVVAAPKGISTATSHIDKNVSGYRGGHIIGKKAIPQVVKSAFKASRVVVYR